MRALDRIAAWLMGRAVVAGELTIEFAGAGSVTYGRGTPRGTIVVRNRTAMLHLARSGVLGFAEGYMDGSLDTPDLQGLLRWGAANHEAWANVRLGRIFRPIRSAWQRLTAERRHARVDSMVDHYNLGNDFYAAWLDPTMTYSSARFIGDDDLEEGQLAKYREIADLAGLAPGMRVLEIGCGWGGFAIFAATNYGCTVVGLTVAEEQARFARKRVANAGLSDLVEIRLEDFRHVRGEFDAIVSIEMIESVDEHVWPELFRSISARLSPRGRAAMQAITIDDAHFGDYRTRRDFIQRYVFPGGQLPSPSVIEQLSEGAGLTALRVRRFGADYAKTLLQWRARFAGAWPALAASGLDERFRRMWDLYLAYCAAGFETGRIDVEHWTFAPVASGVR